MTVWLYCVLLGEENRDEDADGRMGEDPGQSENSSPEHGTTKPATVVKVVFSTTKVGPDRTTIWSQYWWGINTLTLKKTLKHKQTNKNESKSLCHFIQTRYVFLMSFNLLIGVYPNFALTRRGGCPECHSVSWSLKLLLHIPSMPCTVSLGYRLLRWRSSLLELLHVFCAWGDQFIQHHQFWNGCAGG